MEYPTVTRSLGRNLLLYLVGVGLAVAGALGLAGAIELNLGIASGLFVVGLGVVIAVHEWLDGPF